MGQQERQEGLKIQRNELPFRKGTSDQPRLRAPSFLQSDYLEYFAREFCIEK